MIDLFTPIVPKERWHSIFEMLMQPHYAPERKVLETWADGFEDRDGKFVREFQTTFESCMWELYLHAYLKEIGASINLKHHAPDFVVDGPEKFCMEATIAAPAQGEQGPVGYDPRDIPEDFNAFNAQAAIRIANSLSGKLTKFRTSYSLLPQAQGKPYVIAVAPFDRAFSHFAVNRPVMAALYGIHYDEEAAIAMGPSATEIPQVEVSGAIKTNGASVPMGLFADAQCKEISAVVFSAVASWGKIRALADNPAARSVYQTLHPSDSGLMPEYRVAKKADYHEHLLDGLHVFHNPFAEYPLTSEALGHERIAQFIPEGEELMTVAPDDFLLMRMISTVR
jgi:hypothetical protein